MFPIKKVLWPTDFSEPAEKGLEAAVGVAERFSAELVLVHVVRPPITPAGSIATAAAAAEGFRAPLIIEELEKSAREKMRAVAQDRVPGGVPSRSLVLVGRPAEEISRVAEEEKIDLIVMATHGQSGWGRIFFGSVAEQVVRLAECPVLTVKRPRE